jgi:KDO2-lipid IV(A) lauroyltransferase
MSTLFYYLILKPLSWLPLSVSYRLSDVMYLLMYRVFGYRKTVVFDNICGSFPEKSPAEQESIAKDFYRYFCDMIFESIRLFSMPEAEYLKRCVVTNPELLEPYARAGKSVIACGGHYANWEMAALAFPHLLKPHRTMGIYSPLKNEAMDELIRGNRGRSGVLLVSRRDVDTYYDENEEMTVDFYVADQSPSNASYGKLHWTRFLSRTTGFLMGPERFAVRNNLPVFYMRFRRVSRGYYEATLIPCTDAPRETEPGHITEFYARTLEKEILRAPAFWLWTHRRWKRGVPEEVPQLTDERPYVTGEYEP